MPGSRATVAEHTTIPQWLKFRSEPFTEFLRTVRAALRRRYGDGMPLSMRVGNSVEQSLLDAVDLGVVCRERLVDTLVLQHRPPANPLDVDTQPILELAHGAGIRVIHLFGGNHGADFPGPDLRPGHSLHSNTSASILGLLAT